MGKGPGWECYVSIMHEPLWCISNASTLGCSGHLRIRLPGDCIGPSWAPWLYRARTPLQLKNVYKSTVSNIQYRYSGNPQWLRFGHFDGDQSQNLIRFSHSNNPRFYKISWKSVENFSHNPVQWETDKQAAAFSRELCYLHDGDWCGKAGAHQGTVILGKRHLILRLNDDNDASCVTCLCNVLILLNIHRHRQTCPWWTKSLHTFILTDKTAGLQ